MSTHDKFQEGVEALAIADPRYAGAAYEFVRDAVTHTVKRQAAAAAGRRTHITGQQLLEGFRELALERFGCLAGEVLEDWGVRRTEDVGHLVFAMVGHGLLGANENDSPADFANGYDFGGAFDAPFRPSRGGKPAERPAPIA